MNNKFHTASASVPMAVAAMLWLAAAPATAANVTIVNSSCASFTTSSDGSGNLTVNCQTTPTNPAAPTCTSLSASPTSLGVGGGPVALTASCTGAATYEWSASPAAALTSPNPANTQSVTIGSTTTFSVVPIAADGTRGSPYARTVSVATTTTSPPPTPTGTIGSCSGFSATRVIDATVPVDAQNNNLYYSSKFGGWGAQDALVIRFTAPPSDAGFSVSAVTASGASSSFHSYVLASEPCVFDATKPSVITSVAQTKTMFTVSMNSNNTTAKSLVPGNTYYLNLSHRLADGTWACGGASCDMLFTFINPQ